MDDTCFLDRPIAAFRMSARLLHCLQNLNCRTLREVTVIERAELLRTPNVGPKTVAELDLLLSGQDPAPLDGPANLVVEKAMLVYRLREEGQLFREIANDLGMSTAYAGQLYNRACRIIRGAHERDLLNAT